jgi:hypothetical protein
MVVLAKSIAIALQDDSLRMAVFAALHDSPHAENKLHFRTYTDGPGRGVLVAAALASGRAEEALRAIRDSAIDLEFYMPVKSHFASWTGGADLLVATSFDVDEDLPVAFAVDGRRVPIASAEIPPATPVLALVRTEMSFASQPQFDHCPPEVIICDHEPPPGGGGPPPPGLYMTFSYINDDFEGFLGGDPEFEVFPNWRLSGATTGSFNQCSGAQAGNPNRAGPGIKSTAYQYDQNNLTWNGNVRIMDTTQLIAAQAVDSVLTYWVFEDDNTACDLRFGASGDANAYLQQIATQGNETPHVWRNRWQYQAQDPLLVYFLRTGWNIIQGLVATSKDDVVAIMVKPSSYGQSYTDANMTLVNPTTSLIVGRAKLVRQ